MGGSGGGGSGYSYGRTSFSSGSQQGEPDSGGAQDPCAINTSTTLAGPVASVVQTIALGDILLVRLDTSGTVPIVEVIQPKTGNLAGTLAAFPGLRILIGCMQSGVQYEFEITQIAGGVFTGMLRNS